MDVDLRKVKMRNSFKAHCRKIIFAISTSGAFDHFCSTDKITKGDWRELHQRGTKIMSRTFVIQNFISSDKS